MITEETAIQIALAYREIGAAEKLLEVVQQAVERFPETDIRQIVRGHPAGLQLGVPTSVSGHTLHNMPYSLARPVIEAHIAGQRARIAILCETARSELEAPR